MATRSEEARLINQLLLDMVRPTRGLRDSLARETSLESGTQVFRAEVALIDLLANGAKRMVDLGNAVGVSAGTISAQIAGLEKKKLVERAHDPTDARSSLISLTEKGVQLARVVLEVRLSGLRRLLAGWNDNDIQRLAHLLGRLKNDEESATETAIIKVDRVLNEMMRSASEEQLTLAMETSLKTGARISRAECAVLDRLRGRTLRQVDLGSKLGVSAPTVAKQVKDLETRGLIERIRDPNHNRAILVGLTEKGLEIAEQRVAISLSFLEDALADWNDKDVDTLMIFVERLSENWFRMDK